MKKELKPGDLVVWRGPYPLSHTYNTLVLILKRTMVPNNAGELYESRYDFSCLIQKTGEIKDIYQGHLEKVS